eukprot:scaffold156592_cov21-Tisochrysis_lutea.AAC.2
MDEEPGQSLPPACFRPCAKLYNTHTHTQWCERELAEQEAQLQSALKSEPLFSQLVTGELAGWSIRGWLPLPVYPGTELKVVTAELRWACRHRWLPLPLLPGDLKQTGGPSVRTTS